MDILLVGSRGREHALALALKQDGRVNDIFCIPGNGGLAGIAHCVKFNVTDVDKIVEFLDDNPNIKLTIISPDEALTVGLADTLNAKGHIAFGASSKAAVMESSKKFCRDLCAKYDIPSPSYKIFDDYNKAKNYVKNHKYPLVVKTNGRTAGKGIMFCRNEKEAQNAMYDVMIAELFGNAGKVIDIEEFIEGQIFTVMTFVDGKTVLPMKAVTCYKRVFDNDMGLSTAGMGASTPVEFYTEELQQIAMDTIFRPIMNALNAEDRELRGALAFNMILTPANELKVVDFTIRFCDAESQVIIPLLKTPILDIVQATIDQTLDTIHLEWENANAVCVIMTSGGYPLEYTKNLKISIADLDDTVKLFHAGTKFVDGELRTSGGRVMGLCSIGASKEECVENIYRNITQITYDGAHYRTDIS
ncbi:MAG: phosphoribosylamine--glycine ligase [Clostridia bacterium]